MKRLFKMILVLFSLVPPLLLSGCAGLYANTREVEDLLVIRTMGLDDDPAGVRLTLASGAGAAAGASSRGVVVSWRDWPAGASLAMQAPSRSSCQG